MVRNIDTVFFKPTITLNTVSFVDDNVSEIKMLCNPVQCVNGVNLLQ